MRRAESGREKLAQAAEFFLVGAPCVQGLVEADRYKASLLVGLHLADQIQIGTDDGADHARRRRCTPWGHAVFADVAAAGNGRYVTAGYLYDAAAGDAVLFGTSRFSSDRIFGDGFD